MTTTIEQLISSAAHEFDVPRDLVHALCMAESSMNPWAMRYEPTYRWLYGSVDAMSDTERTGQKISWGLMQIMGAVAREYGFTGWFPSLCDPAVGLKYGVKHIARFYQRHNNWPDAIASYNAGSPRKDAAGRYVNQSYVDTVLRIWDAQESQIPLKSTEA